MKGNRLNNQTEMKSKIAMTLDPTLLGRLGLEDAGVREPRGGSSPRSKTRS